MPLFTTLIVLAHSGLYARQNACRFVQLLLLMSKGC